MTRWLILAGLILAALTTLLLVGHEILAPDPAGDADEGSPLDRALEQDEADDDGAATPALSDATAVRAKRAARDAAEAAAAAARADGPTGPYEITIIDAGTQAPLEKVELRRLDDEVLGATDENGIWRTTDAGTNRLSFRAIREGYVIHGAIASPDRPLEIALHPGVAVEGVVLRAAGDSPVPDATVRVWDNDVGREIVATSTDPKGRFRMHAVRPHHPLTVVVEAPERAPFLTRALFDTQPPAPYVVRVPEGNRVVGVVRRASGEPAAHATVWLLPQDRRPLQESLARGRHEERRKLGPRDVLVARTAVTQTDEDGNYAFAGVEPMHGWVPAAFASRRHIVRGDLVRFASEGETRHVDIQLEQSATLRLSVKDAAGNTMSHADIRIRTPQGSFIPEPTDRWEDGVLVVHGLAPGRIHGAAELPGRKPISGHTEIAGGASGRIELAFEAGETLLGTVRDVDGEPIWKAHVLWRPSGSKLMLDTYTDRKGDFAFHGLEAGDGQLSVRARDLPHTRTTYESWIQDGIVVGEGRQQITLKNGPAVVGRFPDLPAGTTLRCRMITADGVSDWPLQLDERGGFRRDGPEPNRGAPLFVFHLRGHTPLLVKERNAFASGEVRDLGSLAFEPTNPRKGRVIGPDRKPIHGAKVSVAERWSGRTTRTDADGNFVMARLPDQPIQLRIEADGLPPARVRWSANSQFRRQVFHLRAGRRVVVVAQDREGRPAAGFQLLARPRPKASSTGGPLPGDVVRTADGKGMATFWLPDGPYEFGAFSDANPRLHAVTAVEVKAQGKRGRGPTVKLVLNGSLR